MKKKAISIIRLLALTTVLLVGCDGEYIPMVDDTANQQKAEATLKVNQQTPTDIDFSLERYNLIRRAYWVNGQKEKAFAVTCAVDKPLG